MYFVLWKQTVQLHVKKLCNYIYDTKIKLSEPYFAW